MYGLLLWTTSFLSLINHFTNEFHLWLCHFVTVSLMKIVENRLTRDWKTVIHGTPYIIVYISPIQMSYGECFVT